MLYLSNNDIASMLEGKMNDVVDVMRKMYKTIINGEWRMGGGVIMLLMECA